MSRNTMSQLGVDIDELKGKVGEAADFRDEVIAPQETVSQEGGESESADANPEMIGPVARVPRERSRRYKEARSQVDRTKEYPVDQAVEVLKRTSYSAFDGTVTAHLNLKRELKQVEVTFPFTTGKTLRVAIANDEILDQLSNGEINFDVLLTDPKFMSKLAKYARLLGPRGLMPNPKTGTVTTDPEMKKKTLEGGALVIRPEKKANLMHIRIGKVSQPAEELQSNLETLLRAVNPLNIDKVTIAASMSPGVKVAIPA